MPWEETHPLDQRLQFVADHQRGLYAMAELCARKELLFLPDLLLPKVVVFLDHNVTRYSR